jgi:hypothetical protein
VMKRTRKDVYRQVTGKGRDRNQRGAQESFHFTLAIRSDPTVLPSHTQSIRVNSGCQASGSLNVATQ